jgi:hypothetical protein
MTTQARYPFPKCFFIYDDYCRDEAAKSEEILLYFWPEEISQEVTSTSEHKKQFSLSFSC